MTSHLRIVLAAALAVLLGEGVVLVGGGGARADYVSGLDPAGDGYLSLRRGPGSNFRLIRRMGPDTILEVLDEKGDWKRVRLEDGTVGWAHGRWIAPGLPGDASAADEVTVPLPGSPDRREILLTAREAAEADIGFAVGLRSDTLRVFGDWAYVQGMPTTTDGKAIDWDATRYGREIRDGFMTDVVMVLMRRDGGAWIVSDSIFGPTDVYWYGWREQYKLPEKLFFSEERGLIPEADWVGAAAPHASTSGPSMSGTSTPEAVAPEAGAPEPFAPGPDADATPSGPVDLNAAMAPGAGGSGAPPATAWRDPAFGFSLALPGDWKVELSDENAMHMVVALAPRDEAGVIVIAVKAGERISPERLRQAVEPLLMQNILTRGKRLSSARRAINGLDGVKARYAGTYISESGPVASTADAFFTSDDKRGFIVFTIVPDVMQARWQQVVDDAMESFTLAGTEGAGQAPQTKATPPTTAPATPPTPPPAAARTPRPVITLQPGKQTPAGPPAASPSPAAPPPADTSANRGQSDLSAASLQAILPARPDGRAWGLALDHAAPRRTPPAPGAVTARYIGFAPDGAEPYETDVDMVVFEGEAGRLDALFAEHRAAPGARGIAGGVEAVEIASEGGVEVWLRRRDGLVRIAAANRDLALSLATTLAR